MNKQIYLTAEQYQLLGNAIERMDFVEVKQIVGVASNQVQTTSAAYSIEDACELVSEYFFSNFNYGSSPQESFNILEYLLNAGMKLNDKLVTIFLTAPIEFQTRSHSILNTAIDNLKAINPQELIEVLNNAADFFINSGDFAAVEYLFQRGVDPDKLPQNKEIIVEVKLFLACSHADFTQMHLLLSQLQPDKENLKNSAGVNCLHVLAQHFLQSSALTATAAMTLFGGIISFIQHYEAKRPDAWFEKAGGWSHHSDGDSAAAVLLKTCGFLLIKNKISLEEVVVFLRFFLLHFAVRARFSVLRDILKEMLEKKSLDCKVYAAFMVPLMLALTKKLESQDKLSPNLYVEIFDELKSFFSGSEEKELLALIQHKANNEWAEKFKLANFPTFIEPMDFVNYARHLLQLNPDDKRVKSAQIVLSVLYNGLVIACSRLDYVNMHFFLDQLTLEDMESEVWPSCLYHVAKQLLDSPPTTVAWDQIILFIQKYEAKKPDSWLEKHYDRNIISQFHYQNWNMAEIFLEGFGNLFFAKRVPFSAAVAFLRFFLLHFESHLKLDDFSSLVENFWRKFLLNKEKYSWVPLVLQLMLALSKKSVLPVMPYDHFGSEREFFLQPGLKESVCSIIERILAMERIITSTEMEEGTESDDEIDGPEENEIKKSVDSWMQVFTIADSVDSMVKKISNFIPTIDGIRRLLSGRDRKRVSLKLILSQALGEDGILTVGFKEKLMAVLFSANNAVLVNTESLIKLIFAVIKMQYNNSILADPEKEAVVLALVMAHSSTFLQPNDLYAYYIEMLSLNPKDPDFYFRKAVELKPENKKHPGLLKLKTKADEALLDNSLLTALPQTFFGGGVAGKKRKREEPKEEGTLHNDLTH